jgi:isopentenyl-diphosphate delta-isomerase type 1
MKTTDDKKELFIVVDENDRFLGYRTRYDCHHDKTLIHRTIGVLIYNSKGEILLQKRSLTKDLNPGKWAVGVGGHVMKGQTYDEAAKREMLEELGINIEIQLVKKWLMKSDAETEMSMLYQGFSEGPFKINLTELTEVKFFQTKILKKLYQLKEIDLSSCAILTFKEIGIF